MFSALRMRIREGKFREPDILLLRDSSDPRYQDRYWLGADLVVEVVSPDDPQRDLVEKRADYAEGGIPEYWIVDPRDETITVLVLRGNAYVEHGVFSRGAAATSPAARRFSPPTCPRCSTPRSRERRRLRHETWDPTRSIDQDHKERPDRNPSKPPSQPGPRSRRASAAPATTTKRNAVAAIFALRFSSRVPRPNANATTR